MRHGPARRRSSALARGARGVLGRGGAAIDWAEPWERVLDDSRAPFYRWFAGGRLNTCYNALDRHVDAGRGEQLALIYDSPVTRHDGDVHLPRAARRGRALRRRARARRASSRATA